MGLIRGAPVPAFVVPDEEAWLIAEGGDGLERLRPTVEVGRAELLLLPERVPHALVPAVLSARAVMPARTPVRTYASPLPGVPAGQALDRPDEHRSGDRHPEGEADGEHGEHDDDGGDDHEGGHDHGDMMEITGEPSADGLVMERIDVVAGPLGIGLPGGLTVAAELDGDVVAGCDVAAILRREDGGAPDPSAAAGWRVAEMTAREAAAGTGGPPEQRWLRLTAVELERVVDHLAWLHRFCRLLAWPHMRDRVRGVLELAAAAHSSLPVGPAADDAPERLARQLPTLEARAAALCGELSESRLLARRTAGLGHLSLDEAARRGVAGPVARAAGIGADVRAGDPGYRALGFSTLVRHDGDARARTLQRAEEAARSVGLAAAAIERARAGAGERDETPGFASPAAGSVEGARGPLRALPSNSNGLARRAPGARAARTAAAELAVGREWAAALVTIASFDLSPWQVAE